MDIALRAAPQGARPLLPALMRALASLWPKRPESPTVLRIDGADARQLRDLGLDQHQVGRPDWTRAPTSWLGPPMT